MSAAANLYRKYMPINFRYKIGKIRAKKYEQQVFESVCSGKWDAEFKEECDYMRSLGRMETFPYKWIEEYDKNQIKVYVDKKNQMPYVKVDGKNLYFPKKYPASYIQTYLNTILIEQDPRSSHYYCAPDDERLKNTVFLDIGGAEGYISLKVISNVKELIIFECAPEWIDALHTTFAPWKEKVTIINKYADETSNSNCVRVDDAAKDKENIVLKIDVEGMESRVLAGAKNILKKSNTKAFVCTYHKSDDERNLKRLLENVGFQVELPESYMFYGRGDISFRKGIVRAWNKT